MRRLASGILACASLWTTAPALAFAKPGAHVEAPAATAPTGPAVPAVVDGEGAASKDELLGMQAALERAIRVYQARAFPLAPKVDVQAQDELVSQQQAFEKEYLRYQLAMQQRYLELAPGVDAPSEGKSP